MEWSRSAGKAGESGGSFRTGTNAAFATGNGFRFGPFKFSDPARHGDQVAAMILVLFA